MDAEEFRRLGYRLVDWVADYREGLARRRLRTRRGHLKFTRSSKCLPMLTMLGPCLGKQVCATLLPQIIPNCAAA